jgi:hypothetical protein
MAIDKIIDARIFV